MGERHVVYDNLDSNRSAGETASREIARHTGRGTTSTARQRWWLRVGLALGALMGVVGLVVVSTADDGRITEARPFLRPTVDGATISATWTGLSCEAIAPGRTEVVPTDTAVRVTLYVDVPVEPCDGDPVEHPVEFTLDEPVGDRDVIDGACLMTGFVDHPACRAQEARLD